MEFQIYTLYMSISPDAAMEMGGGVRHLRRGYYPGNFLILPYSLGIYIPWCRKRSNPRCSCVDWARVMSAQKRMIGDPFFSTLELQVLNKQSTDVFFRAPNSWLAGCRRILILGGTRLAEVSESRFFILLSFSPLQT